MYFVYDSLTLFEQIRQSPKLCINLLITKTHLFLYKSIFDRYIQSNIVNYFDFHCRYKSFITVDYTLTAAYQTVYSLFNKQETDYHRREK